MSASHVGSEQTITVGGTSYRLGRLRRKEWRAFHDWAVDLLPDILGKLAETIEKFPAHLQPVMASEAVQLVNEPIERRTNALLDTPSGWAKLVHLLLQEHQPQITDDEAWDVAIAIKQEMWDVISKAEGKLEGKASGKEASSVGNASTDSLPNNAA